MSQLFNRRSAMGVAGAFAGGAASLMGSKSALAKLARDDFEPRGTDGILERLPTLDLESYDEFSTSTRVWINSELSRAAERRATEMMKANGIAPDDEVSFETAVELLIDDPIIAFHTHSWQRLQMHMWSELLREFNSNYDAYMSEMEAADNSGPGVLELNPGIEPEYTKHEIHMQPGGYTTTAPTISTTAITIKISAMLVWRTPFLNRPTARSDASSMRAAVAANRLWL